MVRMGLILGIILAGLVFVLPQKAKAADSDIVINEVMSHPLAPQSKLEWVELYNNGKEPIDLNGWVFENKIINNPLAIIQSENYLILARDPSSLLDIDPTIPIIQTTMVLTDGGDTIVFKKDDYLEQFIWLQDSGVNFSWERIDSLISSDANWHKSLVSGGTPGAQNSVSKILPPQSPTNLSPVAGQILTSLDDLNFTWQGDVNTIEYQFILSTDSDFINIIDTAELTSPSYKITADLDYRTYYWQVVAKNNLYESPPVISNFVLQEPVYSNDIIINEILPNPDSDEATGEWLELYNNSAATVDISGWIIRDISGATAQYQIPDFTFILPFGYYLLDREASGITLNNDGDGLQLLWPNGTLISQTAFSELSGNAPAGAAWAQGPDGNWSWTTTSTPGIENVITPIPVVAPKPKATVKTVTKKTTSKATVKKAASAVVSAVKAPVVEKAVAAASSNNADANQNDNKINAFDQLVKTMIGLAILFLVFLILKIWQKPKEKNIRQIGGHFGDDFT